MPRSAFPLIIALLLPVVASTQQPDIPPGTRIRATPSSPAQPPVIGTVVRRLGDTLVIQKPQGDTTRMTLSTLELLEFSGGRRSNAWKGAGYGLLIGGAGGAAAGAAAIDSEWRAVGALLGAGVGALGGLLLGGAIGSNSTSEYWKPAPGWQLSLTPGAASTGIGVSIRF